ncbi:lytic transglycosylase F [Vibrio sp. T187]|uniref:transglycosylase SLT domain-containing protein n=1 Tax=Vibrio TaxID=662 RepID=UPI0010CA0DC8|nr:lytic transglycosylase F [Vibrio sp. T187]
MDVGVKKLLIILSILICAPFKLGALELSPLSKEPYTGDLDELTKKNIVRVLVSADLGFYYIEGGRPKGIIAELLYYFEKQLKQKNQYMNIQIIPVQRDDLLPSLSRGYGDLAVANLTITEKRLKNVDFSNPVIKDVQELIVTGKNHPPISSIEQLSGKEIWVRASSSYFESIQNINQQLNEKGLPPVFVQFIEETLQDYELVEMINQGYIEATVLDSHKTALWLNVLDNIQVHRDFPLRDSGQIAWALRHNSPKLKSEVNQYLKKAKTGTLLGNVIYGKYLGNTKWLSRALNPSKIAKLEHLSALFSQYSNQYEFDSLMISAQAYQESGLDQSKVSHRGAVGIMQVLPSTAKDPNVNIKNIYEVENNIHAGVKYMRFIKDRYFDNEEISIDNQIYFSLAAYNAGPAKIRKMRRLAIKHGYNPNIWFKNVEVIARRNIGREPVHYVANINRYYVIYKQLDKIQQIRKEGNAQLLPKQPVSLMHISQ